MIRHQNAFVVRCSVWVRIIIIMDLVADEEDEKQEDAKEDEEQKDAEEDEEREKEDEEQDVSYEAFSTVCCRSNT